MSTSLLGAFGLAWLVGLSLVVVLLVRQVSLISVRLDLNMRMSDASDLGTGPELGTALPADLAHSFPEESAVLVLTGTCESCHEFARSLAEAKTAQRVPLTVLLPGRGRPATELRRLLPEWVSVVRDPVATETARTLELSRTRRALRVRRGVVVGSADTSNVIELDALMSADLPPDNLVTR